jgi:hypothetical protein
VGLCRPFLTIALAALLPALTPAGETAPRQQPETRPPVTTPTDRANGPVLAGRVIDGLGRPVPGVSLTPRPSARVPAKPLAVVSTGSDGRFSWPIPDGGTDLWLEFEKDGYLKMSISADPPRVEEITLHRKIDWGETQVLPYRKGAELDTGMKEVFASEEWASSDRELLDFLFKEQASLRPAVRRLIGDAHVGAGAKWWLDLLGDPDDQDLFPQGRNYAPKHEIRETDLVEAIKAISRKLNFFSRSPEPRINVEFIAFTPKMDRALVQCGINMAPFTGRLWRFVFVKQDQRWVLRSMQEAGRG